MPTIQTQRAQVAAEAVVSAYIHELATLDRPVERPARRSRAVAAAARARRALSRLEEPQLLRAEPPVELDLGRFANELAAEQSQGASDSRCAA
jgi:hypothetical protein